jgi:hypothetical protein
MGVTTDLIEEGDGLVRKHTQKITQAFLDDLKDSRNESTSKKEGEFMRAASIPVAVIEQWTREGFDVYEATGKEIIKRLRDQNLDYFLATDKRI